MTNFLNSTQVNRLAAYANALHNLADEIEVNGRDSVPALDASAWRARSSIRALRAGIDPEQLSVLEVEILGNADIL